jgi:PAS domain-containing protein
MKIRQNVRHWAAKKALTTPVVGDFANRKLVDLHTDIFLGKADEARREERREHLDAFFDATMDAYVAALEAGYTEAKAREITHVQANFDFFNHGWTEMMEIPAEELEDHYRRYEEFFTHYDITIDDPLGAFAPVSGVPEAPPTPEKRDEGEFENALAGFADDVYVEDDAGQVSVGGEDEEPDVDVRDAPGMTEYDEEEGGANADD